MSILLILQADLYEKKGGHSPSDKLLKNDLFYAQALMLWHNNDNNRRIMTRDYNARSGRLKNVQVVCILLQEAQSIPFIKGGLTCKKSWDVKCV